MTCLCFSFLSTCRPNSLNDHSDSSHPSAWLASSLFVLCVCVFKFQCYYCLSLLLNVLHSHIKQSGWSYCEHRWIRRQSLGIGCEVWERIRGAYYKMLWWLIGQCTTLGISLIIFYSYFLCFFFPFNFSSIYHYFIFYIEAATFLY